MSIRKQYDTDLEALKAALVEMGSNSAEAVEAALEALCTADAEAAQKIVKGDSRINNMEQDIEHRCRTACCFYLFFHFGMKPTERESFIKHINSFF